MSRPSLGFALMLMLAGLVLLASNAAGNLTALPLVGVPVGAASGIGGLGGAGQSNPPLTPSSSPFIEQEIVSSLIVLGVLLGFMVWRFRKLAPRYQGSSFDLLFMALALGIFIAIMVAGRAVVDLFVSAGGVRSGSVDYLEASTVFYATAALAVSAIIASLVYSVRGRKNRRPTPNDSGEAMVHEVTDVLHGAMYSLRTSSDHRQVVLNCYRALCNVLQEGGAEDSPELTAREFEAMAAAKLHIRTSYLERLTQLFEKARYSSDVVDGQDAESAETSLVALERELRSRSTAPAQSGGLGR